MCTRCSVILEVSSAQHMDVLLKNRVLFSGINKRNQLSPGMNPPPGVAEHEDEQVTSTRGPKVAEDALQG